jgi:hypothetical protein
MCAKFDNQKVHHNMILKKQVQYLCFCFCFWLFCVHVCKWLGQVSTSSPVFDNKEKGDMDFVGHKLTASFWA